MPSEYIKCIDCRYDFEFTEEEREFYKERDFAPPKRCKKCRIAKKARFNERERKQEGGDGSKEFGSQTF